jgi:hypothetical protein
MARVTYNRRPVAEQPTKEELEQSLLDKLRERRKDRKDREDRGDANGLPPDIKRFGALHHTDMSSIELLKPAGSAVQLIFGFGAAVKAERASSGKVAR